MRGAANHLSDPEYFTKSRGATATLLCGGTGLLGHVMTRAQLERIPHNKRLRSGTRVLLRMLGLKGVAVLDLKFTKSNLLMAVGNY